MNLFVPKFGHDVGPFDPNDWRQLVKRGNTIQCQGIRDGVKEPCFETAEVQHSGELPAGWVLMREQIHLVDGYCLSAYCPACDPRVVLGIEV